MTKQIFDKDLICYKIILEVIIATTTLIVDSAVVKIRCSLKFLSDNTWCYTLNRYLRNAKSNFQDTMIILERA